MTKVDEKTFISAAVFITCLALIAIIVIGVAFVNWFGAAQAKEIFLIAATFIAFFCYAAWMNSRLRKAERRTIRILGAALRSRGSNESVRVDCPRCESLMERRPGKKLLYKCTVCLKEIDFDATREGEVP